MDRRGLTLLELVVVVAILAVLIGLLLPAVQGVRRTALGATCANRQKQLILAAHHYAANHGEQFPAYVLNPPEISVPPPAGSPVPTVPWKYATPFIQLLPYLEQGAAFRKLAESAGADAGIVQRNFQCPLDPSPGAAAARSPSEYRGMKTLMVSYAMNCAVFGQPATARLGGAMPDGSSATIAFAEHYALCNETVFDYMYNGGFPFDHSYAVFAGYWNGGPLTRGTPPVTTGRDLPVGATFQVRPVGSGCHSGMAQTGHAGGMSVAMADGSVRTIRADVSSAAYWAATTPAAGEVAPLD